MPSVCTGCWTTFSEKTDRCAGCRRWPGSVTRLEDLVGFDLGPKCRAVGRLGSGAMGTAYLCRDALDAPVVAKVVSPEFAGNPRARALFELEARAQASLRGGPRILTILAFEASEVRGEEVRYLLLEYASGGSLADRREQWRRFTETDYRRIGAQVAEALAFAHRNEILHRDIKPANVFLDPVGGVLVGDFGLARRLTEIRGSISGTPAYMAPEVLSRGKEEVDRRADLYSLGATLYELASGSLPFEIPLADLISGRRTPGIVRGVLPPPLREGRPDLSEDFVHIVHRLLMRDPAERFGDAEECSRALSGQVLAAAPAATITAAPSLMPCLRVCVEPVPGRVVVNDADRGVADSEGLVVEELPANQELRIKAWSTDRHHGTADTIRVLREGEGTVEVRLRLPRLKGRVRIEDGPPDALVILEGPEGRAIEDRLDGEGMLVLSALEAGEYKVAIAPPRHKVIHESVTVEPGHTAIVRVKGNIEMKEGSLAVDSDPTGAEVFRESTRIGSTPLAPRALRPGKFRLRIVHPEADDWTREVEVRPCELLDLGTVTLPPLGWVDVKGLGPDVLVTLDGEPIRGRRPVRSGQVTVLASRKGYNSRLVRVQVVSGRGVVPEIPPWEEKRPEAELPCQSCDALNTVSLGGETVEFRCRGCGAFNELGKYGPKPPPEKRWTVAGHVMETKIGEGTIGAVWKAVRTEGGRERLVAVKVLHEEKQNRPKVRNSWLLGAAECTRLEDPRIVRIERVGIDPTSNRCFMTMEFVDGEPLERRVVREGPLGWRAATRLVAQCAEGLGHAHRLGIVHGSLHPKGILIDRNGDPKLSDFEQNKFFVGKRDRREGHAAGREGGVGTTVVVTLDAIPPEVFEGRVPTERGDIYSLGVTYYYALCGHWPFTTVASILVDTPPSVHNVVPGLPGAVGAILKRMMARSEGERFGTCREVYSALRAAMEEEGD